MCKRAVLAYDGRVRIGVSGLVLSLIPACTGGQTSIGSHDFGLSDSGTGGLGGAGAAGAGAAGAGAGGTAVSGAGSGGQPCAWSGDDGLVADFRANGDLENQVACSPLEARIAGQVAYGPGQLDQAWQFRSTWTSVDGGDPNFVELVETQPFTLGQLTIDTWLQQTSFNAYQNSNRLVFSTSYRPQPDMLPGEAQIYVHENKTYLAFVKVGSAAVLDDDWVGCHFRSLGEPEVQAPLDTWFRLSITYDGAVVRCYTNGVLETETPLAMKEPATADLAPLVGRNYPGDVDAVRLFNRALSAEELAVPWP